MGVLWNSWVVLENLLKNGALVARMDITGFFSLKLICQFQMPDSRAGLLWINPEFKSFIRLLMCVRLGYLCRSSKYTVCVHMSQER